MQYARGFIPNWTCYLCRIQRTVIIELNEYAVHILQNEAKSMNQAVEYYNGASFKFSEQYLLRSNSCFIDKTHAVSLFFIKPIIVVINRHFHLF